MTENETNRERPVDGPLPVPDLPPRLLMDLAGGVCNLRCPKCYVFGMSDAKTIKSLRGDMSLENARRILDEVAAIKPIIQPQLWSESLMAKNFREHVAAMKTAGAAVAINTNGLLLKEDMARFFVDVQLDSLSISIDAVTPDTLQQVRATRELDRIEQAVFMMLKMRVGHKYPRIGVSFTVEAENQQERDPFVARWLPHVDVVRVNERYEADGHTAAGDAYAGPRVPCRSLYETLPIQHNGDVSICCLDAFNQVKMGNVLKEGVHGVWHGEAFRKIRHYHETNQYDKIPFCQTCNVWMSYLYTETVENGVLIRRSPLMTYYNRVDSSDNIPARMSGKIGDVQK